MKFDGMSRNGTRLRPASSLSRVDWAILVVAVIAGFVVTTIAVRSGLMFEQVANLIEGIFWIAAATVLLRRSWHTTHRRLALGAAITLAVFGISDFIEVRTGAWYEPVSLLILKSACVAALALHLTLFLRWWSRAHAPRGKSG